MQQIKLYSFTLIVLLIHISNFLSAQSTVTGIVVDDQGRSLMGATVSERGVRSYGTVTDADGSFALAVASKAVIIIRYVGFIDQEFPVDTSSHLKVVMKPGLHLSEVVVTALGISREQKSLGYAVQQIERDQLTLTRETNLVSSLAGKIAGVQVTTASGASIGGSANIRIRGSNGLTGGSPLFVVDGTPISNSNFSASNLGTDFGNLAQDINPDDIDKVTVLKGPSATALYGNRAANGVVMITTKKGSAGSGLGITINSSVTTQDVYLTPEYQNEYAGGYDGQLQDFVDPVDGRSYKVLEYYADESWGPRMDGNMYRPWWSWYPGEHYGTEIPLVANPNNVQDFFRTGLIFNNNVALNGSNDLGSFRLSYTNIHQDGVMPNSSLRRNNFMASSSLNLTNRLTVSANLNFVSTDGKGRPEFGYSTNNPVLSFNQWFQRQLDIHRLRDYKNPDGTFSSWNIRSPVNLRPLYWDSPFFSLFENYSTDSRERYFGNVTATYEITQDLSIEGSFRRDQYTQRIEKRGASGGLEEAFYSERVVDATEDNYDFLVKYNKGLRGFTLDAYAGGSLRNNQYHSNFAGTVGGLSAPNLFNLRASVDRPSLSSYISEKKVQSVYGAATVGYRGILYLGGTLRNDWSSALPVDQNSYLYPSANLSFVFSELFNSQIISLGKFRASFAQVGSDLGPYQTIQTFSAGRPYGSNASFAVPRTLVNDELRPALSNSIEFGLDLRFLNNRFGVDVTYYKENNKDQILTLQVPGSSGYSSAIINAGNIQDQGVELSILATPIRSRRVNWELIFNLARNKSEVLELAEGLDNRVLSGFAFITINAPVGGEWGMMRGTAFSRVNGVPVIDEAGQYVPLRDQDLGTFLPDYTGGLVNRVTVFGIEVAAFVDFQIGGQFHSITKMFNAYSGLSIETVGLNDKGVEIRAPVSEGGGIRVDGVRSDGTPHTVYVTPEEHYKGLFFLHERWIYDASYVKLRELSIGYRLSEAMVAKMPLTSAKVSLVAHNLWLIHSEVEGIDPSELSPGSNPYVYHETGILPGVRSFGVNLQFGF